MRVALIHYWLRSMRGGERVLEAFSEMFPDADIFTHIVQRDQLSDQLNRHDIKTTFISKMPFANRHYQKYLPFMPRALEELDLSDYDLVISSESGPAKGVIVRPDAFHLCYCHSPMRYIWDLYPHYLNASGFLARQVFPGIAHRLRTWDVSTAARVDQFVANSSFVRQRINKYYRRDSEVVFPPVAVDEFEAAAVDGPGDYYLAAGELVGYKRFDLVVEAFTKLGKPLVVVGEGEQAKQLKKVAGDTITFADRVSFSELKQRFGACKALVFPGEEDFGMVPVEVMAAGRPVIAYGRGGALDTVVDGKTGLLFHEQTVEALIAAIETFETMRFDKQEIQTHARQFGPDPFKTKIRRVLADNGIDIPA
ncbi:MAG: glycosyltransferase [Henriciella sp.]|nr:glycosyltransferase [Henriciella sp.]